MAPIRLYLLIRLNQQFYEVLFIRSAIPGILQYMTRSMNELTYCPATQEDPTMGGPRWYL